MTSPVKPEAALFLFHLRVGARLALRALAPVLAAVVFLIYILRLEFALELARILFLEGSLVESGLIGTLILTGLARIVAPRIAAGGGGWARSLPVGGGALRVSAVLSMVVAEAPVLAVLAALAWIVTGPHPASAMTHIAGLVVGAAGAGLANLPSSAKPWTKALPVAVCFLSFAGDAAILALTAVLLVFSMAWPGKTAGSRKKRGPRGSLPPAAFFHGVALRAVRGRVLLAYVPPVVILGAAKLFLKNNELSRGSAFALSLFALSLSLIGFIGPAADLLAARRPAWPWLRSLPRSASSRVRDDALFFALLALPLFGGIAVLSRPAHEALYLAGPLAWFAVRGAGAMRESGDRPFGVLGQAVIEGIILSLVLALLPWTAALLAAATPIAFLLARNAERRLKPTRWVERHHSGAGDPLSWSAS